MEKKTSGSADIRMYDYILEERRVLEQIVSDRARIAEAFCRYMTSHEVDEIVISGSGTSYHAALAVRAFLENILRIRVRAEYPMMFKDLQTIYDPATLFIGISQGGQSQSTVDAMKKAKRLGVATAGISENNQAEIFKSADIRIVMECGPELSVAKTKGYVATMAILFVLGIEAAKARGNVSSEQCREYIRRLETVVANYDRIIPAATQWVNGIRAELARSRRIVVLGYKNQYANVLEGALKMLETMRFGIYGYDIEEFFHGIYNSIDGNTTLIYLASEGEYQTKVVALKKVLEETTKHQYVISKGIAGYVPDQRDCILPFMDDEVFSVFEYILPMQIIASLVPYDLGIDPFTASDPQFHAKMKSKVV